MKKQQHNNTEIPLLNGADGALTYPHENTLGSKTEAEQKDDQVRTTPWYQSLLESPVNLLK